MNLLNVMHALKTQNNHINKKVTLFKKQEGKENMENRTDSLRCPQLSCISIKSIEPNPIHRNYACNWKEEKNPKIIRSEEVTRCITLLNGQLQSYTLHPYIYSSLLGRNIKRKKNTKRKQCQYGYCKTTVLYSYYTNILLNCRWLAVSVSMHVRLQPKTTYIDWIVLTRRAF